VVFCGAGLVTTRDLLDVKLTSTHENGAGV